jgi:hypothetical protein
MSKLPVSLGLILRLGSFFLTSSCAEEFPAKTAGSTWGNVLWETLYSALPHVDVSILLITPGFSDAQSGAIRPLVKFSLGAPYMGPAQRQPLLNALLELSDLQVEAMIDATYMGWTAELQQAYEDRWKKITEIHAQLNQP